MSASGYFEAFVNSRAARVGPAERALMVLVKTGVNSVIPRAQVHWAGSQRKGTGIIGSDLDMCVESADPVTEALRRDLRGVLEREVGRPATVKTHVVRLAGTPKIDIAFANAGFGGRPLPNIVEFHNRPGRQAAARALKLWIRAGGLPHISGWAIEALVVHLDQPVGRGGLELFQRITCWIDEKATSTALEGVLRAANFNRWNQAWSAGVPGPLEALRNSARALRRRSPPPEGWRSPDDVGRWLSP